MSVQVIFSFDSEDYETPASDDAEKWWAETLARHGITGCFCIVGELVRALRDRGRQDVLDAWSRHEVAYHSDMHSAHPTHAEYLDTMDWDEGVRAVMERESRGLRDVAEALGQTPSAHCKPGSSWGPQVAYAMPRMGVPVFCDAPFEQAPGQPMWFDNCLPFADRLHPAANERPPGASARAAAPLVTSSTPISDPVMAVLSLGLAGGRPALPPLLYRGGRACRPPSSRPRGGGEPYRRAKAPKSGDGIEPG